MLMPYYPDSQYSMIYMYMKCRVVAGGSEACVNLACEALITDMHEQQCTLNSHSFKFNYAAQLHKNAFDLRCI